MLRVRWWWPADARANGDPQADGRPVICAYYGRSVICAYVRANARAHNHAYADARAFVDAYADCCAHSFASCC